MTFRQNIKIEGLSKEGQRALIIKAAEEGDCDTVRRLLAVGADINARDDERCTPLIIAAAKGDVNMLNLLLNPPNYSINYTVQKHGWLLYGEPTIIEHDLFLEDVDQYNNTALLNAARHGQK